ncbi:rRNA pseudouridine synthase [Candidatus Falkowbacteria bacterium]|jgi:pseudouridine synthase|nr:rRNA pseudouridine synthase [Candidatus Falkowbacteria bacterium]MBT4432907.1 rRNA pseudouridine synthase [Candidatus Falkowbacteria bacterium]
MNLQKYIASCGVCSRRGAEKLIIKGQITINNKIARVTDRVQENDTVKLNNKLIKPIDKKVYIMLNKPVGYTCTTKTFKDEKNIFELIKLKERLFTVGRLDKDSSGLLILTNDGDLTLKLTHPKYRHEKEYEVLVDKKITIKNIEELKRGVFIKDENKNQSIKVKAKSIKKQGDNKISLIIAEGKKRQVRQMLSAAGLRVVKLKRTRVSSLLLGDLPEGKSRDLTDREIKSLN